MCKYISAYKYIFSLFFLTIGNLAGAQCLTSSLIINTGYNPVTAAAITPGANGAAAVTDPHWIVTAISAATSAAIAATPGGYIPVVPGNSADVVVPVGAAWITNPAGNPGAWISCLNSDTYNDQGNGLPLTMTLGRPFRLCSDDSIKITMYVSSDNLTPSADIDGTVIPLPTTGFSSYTFFTQTVWLTSGTHTIHFVVQNQNVNTVSSNPTGLNVYGTVASSTGVNSLVSESIPTCGSYNCSTTCNTITLPDTVRICQGGSDTLRAVVNGPDPILTTTWSPVTGLSSSTVLRPLLTVGTTSGWYDLTVQSLIPYQLVYNGDFSLGNTGFSSSYAYVSGPNSLQPASSYAITTNPLLVHTGIASFGDHTTGTGNMMAINGASTAISVWCQTIAVTPNTNYAFSAWATIWSSISVGAQAPILQFQIDGVLIGSPFTINSAPGAWMNFYAVWNSGANTTATICIYDACTAASGNDFSLDDISFQQICVTRDSIYADVLHLDSTFSHVNDSVCPPITSVTLTAPTGYSSYAWSTGSHSSSVVVNATGAYEVYAGGVCSMFVDTFYVALAHVDTSYTHHDTSVCANVSGVTLNAPTGFAAYLWSTASTGSSIVVSSPGSYWVYAPSPCAMLIDTFHVVYKPLPAAPPTTDTFYCVNYGSPAPLTAQVGAVTGTLNWYITGIPLSGTPTPPTNVVTYPVGTTWYVSQTVNGCEGDSSAVNVNIVAPPNISISAQQWVCQFDTISLTYTGPAVVNGGFLWSLPTGASTVNGTSLTDSSIYVRFDSSIGGNIVTLTANNLLGECSNTESLPIDVVELPKAIAYSKPEVCLSDTVSLALSSRSVSAIDFLWYIDTSPLFSSGAATVIASNSSTGGPFSISWTDTGLHIIHVQAIAEHGCTNKPTADTVLVHALPDASFRITTLNGSLCLEDSVLFAANDSNYQNLYSWAPAHFFTNTNGHAEWGKVEQAKSVVTLTVTDPFGCVGSGTKELDPTVCCTIPFPNAFSPNGDTRNDVFRPIQMNGYHTYHVFRIQNRWGQTIFESTNNRAEWDGTFNGVPQDIGVYFYYLKFDCDGKTVEQKGDVTLVR